MKCQGDGHLATKDNKAGKGQQFGIREIGVGLSASLRASRLEGADAVTPFVEVVGA